MATRLFNRIPVAFAIPAPTEFGLGTIQSYLSGGATGFAFQAIATVVSAAFNRAGSTAPRASAISNLSKMIVIPMLVNPTSISIQKNPKVNSTLTKRGMLYQYWPSEPDLMSFQGRAASGTAFFTLSQLDTLMQTMEDGTRNLSYLIYKFGGVYAGYFLNFRTTGDAMQPGIFDYSFDFQFVERNHLRLFLYAMTASSLNEAILQPGKFFTESIKMGASQLAQTSGLSIAGSIKI